MSSNHFSCIIIICNTILLDQNKGKLSKRKRQQDFDELSEEEISIFEENYSDIFEK